MRHPRTLVASQDSIRTELGGTSIVRPDVYCSLGLELEAAPYHRMQRVPFLLMSLSID